MSIRADPKWQVARQRGGAGERSTEARRPVMCKKVGREALEA